MKDDKWYQNTWLPAAAFMYLGICCFDFVLMPVYTALHNGRIENREIQILEGKDAAAYADSIIKANQATRQWNPLTLMGGGMFHLSFGALLSGGAVTRGLAKSKEVEGYYKAIASGSGKDPDEK